MTVAEVRELVSSLSAGKLSTINDHHVALKNALVEPRMITIIARTTKKCRPRDERLCVWLVGQESPRGGYLMVLSEDGSRFGLAAEGFAQDKFPILCGWYGSLLTAFLGM